MTVSSFDLASLINILPEILLLLLAAVVMVVDVFLPEGRKKTLGVINVVGLSIILGVAILWRPETELALGGDDPR